TSRRDQTAFEHHKAGKVLAFAAETVVDPTAHARPSLKAGTRVHEVIRRRMLGMVCDHASNDGHVIDACRYGWEEFTDPGAALAMFFEGERRGKNLVADVEDSCRIFEWQ